MRRVRGATIGATLIALAMLDSHGALQAGHNGDWGGWRGVRMLQASLVGFQEAPAVSSTGRGSFEAKVYDDFFDYELSYRALEGSITQSHIHIGQFSVSGGIAIWLCETTANPAPDSVKDATPTCDGTTQGNVTGRITAAEVIGPSGQGIAAGEFEEVLRAMRAGVAYVNVHSSKHGGGEIRGQIHGRLFDRD